MPDDVLAMSIVASLTGSPPSAPRPAVVEHTRVRLKSDVVERDILYRADSTGTVVHVYRDGAAFEVEITHPCHEVVMVEAGALEALRS
jgi:hypothetical protein